jgi:hypothetical protein
MGMFDMVNFKCPKCEGPIQEQSKAGSCSMQEYDALRVPPSIAADLVGTDAYCEVCNETFTIMAPAMPAMVTLTLA